MQGSPSHSPIAVPTTPGSASSDWLCAASVSSMVLRATAGSP